MDKVFRPIDNARTWADLKRGVYGALEAACFTPDFKLCSWNYSIIQDIDVFILSDVLLASSK